MSRRKNNYDVVTDVTTTEVEDGFENNEVDMENVNGKIVDDVDKYEAKISDENSIKKHKVCKIIKFISKTRAIINFNGKGLIINVGSNLSTPCSTVDIEYIGEIGKSDFSYEVAKK